MPDLPASALAAAPPSELLLTLLDVSLAGVVLLAPVWADGQAEAVDWTLTYLNPAAQHLLDLEARPATTLRRHYPDAQAAGLLALCWAAYAATTPHTGYYRPTGLGPALQLAARRSGELLVLSVAASSAPIALTQPLPGRQPAAAVLAAQNAPLAPPQQDEAIAYEKLLTHNAELQHLNHELQVALATAEQAQASTAHELRLLQTVLKHAPMAVGLFQGPNQTIVTANDQLCAMWGYPPERVLGRPLLQAVPELRAQGFAELIGQVAQTRTPFVGKEQPMQVRQGGLLETRYFDFVYQPLLDSAGGLLGVLDIAIDVTAQIQDRLQIQALNEELGSTNEELHAINEELFTNNEALLRTQQELQQLAQLLEDRVQERTRQLREALQETEAQRERLREQQSLLRQILWQVPASIATLSGPEHRYSFFNASYHTLTGERAQLGLPVAEALPEVASQGFTKLLNGVYRSGQPVTGTETPIELYDAASGQHISRYIDFVYQPLTDANGQTTGILAFILDSTEKVRARAAIEASTRQVRLMTDALPVLIGYLDRDERYQFTNQAYEPWFQRPASELLGCLVKDVIGEKAYAGVKQYIDRVLAGERLCFEARMPYREGFVKYIRTDYIPDVSNGEVLGFYSLVSDVTEQVKAQQQVAAANEQLRANNTNLDALNQQLRRTNVDLDNFIYSASHDLKSPITNIEGLVQVLTEHLPAEVLALDQVQPIMKLMQHSVDRFKRTIDYLTDVSKLQQEYAQPIESVVLADVVEDVRQDLLPLLQETSGQLHVDIADCPTISFSPKNLRSVVYNLLSNAFKYRHSARQPEVRISCHLADGYQLLQVQDNGLGLDDSQQARIFGMFQRLHSHVEGSGIGLYMVKKIVENAGGTISVASTAGEGSTFTVAFPVPG